MPFSRDTYSFERADLIRRFAEGHSMWPSFMYEQHAPAPDFDAWFLRGCLLNNFAQEKRALNQEEVENYMQRTGVTKLLVPVVVDSANDQWAIVVYKIDAALPSLTYYNLNGNFATQIIVDAFCDVMNCHQDSFFTTAANYHRAELSFVNQNIDAPQVWRALEVLMTSAPAAEATSASSQRLERALTLTQVLTNQSQGEGPAATDTHTILGMLTPPPTLSPPISQEPINPHF